MKNIEEVTKKNSKLPSRSVRHRVLGWWEKLPDNMNGKDSKFQLSYEYYDRHWMNLTYREIEYIWGQHVA